MLYFLVQQCSLLNINSPSFPCVPRQSRLFMSSTPVDTRSGSREIMLERSSIAQQTEATGMNMYIYVGDWIDLNNDTKDLMKRRQL